MRIHVSFVDRVGITQEVLAVLGARHLNLDAVEMVPPNVYIDAPTLSAEVLEELRGALLSVQGVQAMTVVDILPGQRRHLQLDALLAAMTDPVLALDSAGSILLANPAMISLYGAELAGASVSQVFADPTLLDTLIEQGFRLPLREVTINGETLLLDATPITNAGALLTLYQPNRIGERLSALHHDHAEGFDSLLGESPPIRTLKARAQRVAALDAPLLIQGETGTGKELIAQAIHRHSHRAARPLIYLNCAALPETVAESELFGHVKGAFTGAIHDRPGKFELADKGTLFLDEIGELSLSLQAKLLRVLQYGDLQRVGEDKALTVDVRIIAATNVDMRKAVTEGRFRADLFHRLSVFPLFVPSLNERRDDIVMLAGYFCEQCRMKFGLLSVALSPAASSLLEAANWPGNVRELEHAIYRAVVIAQAESPTGEVILFPQHFSFGDQQHPASRLTESVNTLPVMSLNDATRKFQYDYIRHVYESSGKVWARVARQLELDPGNLHRLARKLGLK